MLPECGGPRPQKRRTSPKRRDQQIALDVSTISQVGNLRYGRLAVCATFLRTFMVPMRVQNLRRLPMNLALERRTPIRHNGEMGSCRFGDRRSVCAGSWPRFASNFWRCSLSTNLQVRTDSTPSLTAFRGGPLGKKVWDTVKRALPRSDDSGSQSLRGGRDKTVQYTPRVCVDPQVYQTGGTLPPREPVNTFAPDQFRQQRRIRAAGQIRSRARHQDNL